MTIAEHFQNRSFQAIVQLSRYRPRFNGNSSGARSCHHRGEDSHGAVRVVDEVGERHEGTPSLRGYRGRWQTEGPQQQTAVKVRGRVVIAAEDSHGAVRVVDEVGERHEGAPSLRGYRGRWQTEGPQQQTAVKVRGRVIIAARTHMEQCV